MTKQDNQKKFLIKDFNVPAPNGNLYEVSDEILEKFCKRPRLYAEHGNPNVSQLAGHSLTTRLLTTEMDKVVAEITSLEFNPENKTITGMVRPMATRMPFLLEQLERKEVVFGMRALVDHDKTVSDKPIIREIITFDIIHSGT